MKRALPWLIFALTATGLGACKTSTPDIPEDAGDQPAHLPLHGLARRGRRGPRWRTPRLGIEWGANAQANAQKKGAEKLRATGPVATVNGEPLPAEAFNEEISKIEATGQLPPHMVAQLDDARRDQIKERVVEGMIVRQLIEQKIEASDFDITDAEIDEKIEQMKAELAFANEMMPGRFGSLEQMMAQMGMDAKNLRASVAQSIALERLVRANHDYEDATPAEAREFYEANKDRFQQPEQVRASHILLKVEAPEGDPAWAEAKKKIEQLHTEASAEGADFAALAREHSDDSSASEGGDLGFFPRGVMVPDFEQAAFSLKDGQLSEPVKSRFGWHLILRTDHRPSGPIPFARVEDQLVRQLTSARFQESLRAYLQELREQAEVTLELDNIT